MKIYRSRSPIDARLRARTSHAQLETRGKIVNTSSDCDDAIGRERDSHSIVSVAQCGVIKLPAY
jgi:hypothetical protein